MPRRSRLADPVVAGLAVAGLAAATLVSSCGGDDRPDVTTWQGIWTSRQALVPDTDTILAGGADLCGERLGVFRTDMPALLPTPADELDASVEDWIAHAETIVFECSSDADELDDLFQTLEVLAAEVDAGVAAERDV